MRMHFLNGFFIISVIFFELAPCTTPKVVVIGAGVAGLATAYSLHKKNIDVDVYEARHRVGGRIFTVLVDGNIVELGGQNIVDGGAARHLRALIGELELELVESSRPLNPQYLSGNTLFEKQKLLQKRQFSPTWLAVYLAELAQRSRTMHEVLHELFTEDDPLYSIVETTLAAYEGASANKLSPLYINTLYHMLLGGISATHSSAGERNYIINVSIKGGNALLTEKLAESLESNIHLDMPLKSISKNSLGAFVLQFPNNHTIIADVLVLAIPCSVYKDIVFASNVIAQPKLSAIQNVAYSTNSKMVVPFPAPDLEKKQFLNDHVIIFPNRDLNSFNLFYTGLSGCFSAETAQAIYEHELPFIKTSLERFTSPMPPVMVEDESFPCYTGVIAHSWCQDPYAQGSYSYIAAGQENVLTALNNDEGEWVKDLFAPIDHKLYFVGEHASILEDALGTMEAACESGIRIANLIEKTLQH